MHSLATRFRGDGLIVHQFDGLKQQRAPWAPCPQDAGRCRCEAASNVTLEKMCAIRDRISASPVVAGERCAAGEARDGRGAVAEHDGDERPHCGLRAD
jgi:hypothetical protein